MASAARTLTRALSRAATPVTSSSSSIRSGVFRNSARFAVPAQSLRASGRRGYSTGQDGTKSSTGLYWGLGAVAAGGAGAFWYLSSDSKPKTDVPFVPTKDDYQKVYDEIAHLLVEKDEYDDGSYGPVRHPRL
jgi:cytochrome c peroxidase